MQVDHARRWARGKSPQSLVLQACWSRNAPPSSLAHSPLMGLFDPTVLSSAKASLPNSLHFNSIVIIIFFSVTWELPLLIFFLFAMKQHI